ncbi:hypothetical protein [Haliscomenobacter sp.]|uniref:hypothetical protein n=1 Tax=Haliscomenobacter sp. TaxID=2717303 RepID=UPI003BA876E4
MKKLYTLVLTLISMSAFAQETKQMQVLKWIQTDETLLSVELEKVANSIITRFNQSKIAQISSNKIPSNLPPNYLLEMKPSTSAAEGFAFRKVVDSTQTIWFDYTAISRSSVGLLVTNISNGTLHSNYNLNGEASVDQEFTLRFQDLGWNKGTAMTDSLKKQITSKAKILLGSKFGPVRAKAFDAMLVNIGVYAANLPFQIFPFRMPFKEVLTTKKDRAVLVAISGLIELGFPLERGVVIYEILERKVDGITYEQAKYLGTAIHQINKKTKAAEFEVSKGGEEILSALNSGKQLWYAPFSPFVKNKYPDARPGIALQMAAADLTPRQWSDLYYKLRVSSLAVRGGYNPIVDRGKNALIQKEREIQKGDAYIDKANIEQFKAVGAGYIIDIQFISFKDVFDQSTHIFRFEVKYVIRLIQVETSEVLAEVSSTFDQSWSHPMAAFSDRKDAQEYMQMSAAGNNYKPVLRTIGLNYLSFNLREVFNRALPLKIDVLEIIEEKKDKAERILVAGNFNAKVKDDDYYICRKKLTQVGGEELIRIEQIGVGDIDGTVGTGMAIIKLKKGEKEVFQAMKAGEKLYCFDKPEWFIDGQYTQQLKRAGF